MITYIVNIVVCYRNEDEIIAYAHQIEKQTVAERMRLCIVVNQINKGLDYLENHLSLINVEFEILYPNKNLGYLNGLLYGYKNGKWNSEWYILSNTDIEYQDQDFIKKFIFNDYIYDNNIWIVGPSIYTTNTKCDSNPYLQKRPLKSFYFFRNFAMNFPNVYELLFHLKKTYRNNINVKHSNHICSVYAVHGSFMLIKNELLQCISTLDEWELLYDEEQFLAEAVRKNKKIVLHNPNVRVFHTEGSCTNKINIRNKYKQMINSNRRIMKEFY